MASVGSAAKADFTERRIGSKLLPRLAARAWWRQQHPSCRSETALQLEPNVWDFAGHSNGTKDKFCFEKRPKGLVQKKSCLLTSACLSQRTMFSESHDGVFKRGICPSAEFLVRFDSLEVKVCDPDLIYSI